MGQTLSRKPISQRSSFATLNGASSAFAPDQSQYQGFTSPMQMDAGFDVPKNPTDSNMITGFQVPSVLGRNLSGGFAGFRSRMMGIQ